MPGNPKVIILSEHLRGQSFELTEEEYTVGRTEECDICIPDPTVSSHHCSLVRLEQGGYKVVDKGSTNGTRVNGARIENEAQALVNSDILQVGGVEMLFDCEETRANGATSTHTVINLEVPEGPELSVPEMQNFSPFGTKRGGPENKKVLMIMGTVIAILAAAVVISLVILLVKLVSL